MRMVTQNKAVKQKFSSFSDTLNDSWMSASATASNICLKLSKEREVNVSEDNVDSSVSKHNNR